VKKGRIKLLITDDSLHLGGKETLLLQQLEHISREKFDVHLVTQTNKGVLLPSAKEKADHYKCLNRKCSLDVIAILKLRKYIKEKSIQIVHTNGWIDSFYVYIATLGLDVSKVSTIHGYDHSWRNIVNHKVLKHFDRIVAVSNSFELELFKMGLPYEKLAIVYNSYDDKAFWKQKKKSSIKNRDLLDIVMTGHFRWSKDQATIIRAAHILKKRGILVKVHLIGAGDPVLMAVCRRLVAELFLTDSIIFAGQKRVDATLLSAFDLFVFSSISETFGIALLEAMACGMPVLVSDIPPLMELIENGKYGLYFETGNAESCADEILRFLEDRDLREKMGERAYSRSQNFTPQKVVRDLEMVYLDTMR